MSTGNRSDDEVRPNSTDEVRPNTSDEDAATRFTRTVVDGFAEASQAFSLELEGTQRFPQLVGRSVAAVIHANAQLLDEVATMVRHASDEWAERPRPAEEEFDYERLADMVAARLGSTTPAAAKAEPPAKAPSGQKA